MDSLAFRLANALVGNDTEAAGLEITLSGTPCTARTTKRGRGGGGSLYAGKSSSEEPLVVS